jgi:hypothetical protein
MNADGGRNSCVNPAKLGSIVSLYVHGIGSPACYCFDAIFGSRSVAVVNVVAVNTYVTRVDVQIPSSFATASSTAGIPATRGGFQVGLSLGQTPAGPLALPRINVVSVGGAMTVWATQ